VLDVLTEKTVIFVSLDSVYTETLNLLTLLKKITNVLHAILGAGHVVPKKVDLIEDNVMNVRKDTIFKTEFVINPEKCVKFTLQLVVGACTVIMDGE
jgi:hypothetical protein